jgi:2-amino-4-hydroxy-6-hydroxymethyldihydropteridine diphosphokinase
MGRHRGGEKWLPRTIDLDLLLYGDHIISSQELIVPHPLMHERRFVLEPLAEIAPDVVHPTLQMTIAGLLENLSRNASATESD